MCASTAVLASKTLRTAKQRWIYCRCWNLYVHTSGMIYPTSCSLTWLLFTFQRRDGSEIARGISSMYRRRRTLPQFPPQKQLKAILMKRIRRWKPPVLKSWNWFCQKMSMNATSSQNAKKTRTFRISQLIHVSHGPTVSPFEEVLQKFRSFMPQGCSWESW